MGDILPVLGTLALVLSGIISFFATVWKGALQRFSDAKLEDLIKAKGRQGDLDRITGYLENELEPIMLTIIVIRTLAEVCFIMMMSLFVIGPSTNHFMTVVWVVLSFTILLVFCRSLPREWAKRNPEGVVLHQIRLLHFLKQLFRPLTALLMAINSFFGEMQGKEANGETVTQDEILSTLEDGEKDGAICEDEREMIENIIELRDAPVSEIMTPRTEMSCISVEASILEAKNLAVESKHSRIPVYQGNRDNVVGVFFVKDLLAHFGKAASLKESLRDIMREPKFVPETTRGQALLQDFLHSKDHLAIVLDEYGGTAGLVTLEDILEEIVGEIPSEVEDVEIDLKVQFKNVGEGVIEADARMHIDDINEELEIDLPEGEDSVTIAGFVFSELGRVPEAGEKIESADATVTVLDADARRIKRVRVAKK